MFIYKAVCKINNKIYIGQTTKTLEHRWKQHIKSANKENHKKGPFQNAIKKYGSENFDLSVVCYANNIDELNHREEFCIRIFNSLVPNGYNANSGGKNKIASKESKEKNRLSHLGKKASDETKLKMSIARKGKKGKKPSEESRKKMSEAHKNRVHPRGYKLSEETRKNISEAHKGQIPWNKGKTGIYSEETKQKMSDSRKGQRVSPDTEFKKGILTDHQKNQMRRIIASNGIIYESINEAVRQLTLQQSNICKVLKGERKSTGGYTFKYLDVKYGT